jgi:hypothetical protein
MDENINDHGDDQGETDGLADRFFPSRETTARLDLSGFKRQPPKITTGSIAPSTSYTRR